MNRALPKRVFLRDVRVFEAHLAARSQWACYDRSIARLVLGGLARGDLDAQEREVFDRLVHGPQPDPAIAAAGDESCVWVSTKTVYFDCSKEARGVLPPGRALALVWCAVNDDVYTGIFLTTWGGVFPNPPRERIASGTHEWLHQN